MVTCGPPLQATLRGPYTTALINFISWNKAYAIFPRLTFLWRETVPLTLVAGAYGPLHCKYGKRGWRMRTESTLDSKKERHLLGDMSRKGNRRIGDKDTWIIRLDRTAVEVSHIPDSVIECSTFKVNYLDIQGRIKPPYND